MRKFALIILIFSPLVFLAQNTWEKKAAFGNDKRSRGVGFAIGNRGYMGLGEDTADVERNDFWEYDPGSDSWMQKASLPAVGRRDAVGFAIGNKGYVGTGIDAAESAFGNNLDDWWEYNPVTNMWTQKQNCPSGAAWGGIYFATGFTANGMGYVLCGKLGNSSYSNQLWQYNPTSNTWLQKTNFPGGTRYSMSAFVVNGRCFAGLGTDENILQNDWWEYIPSSNTWVQKASLPGSGRFAAMGFAIGTKGYVVCGSDGGYQDDLWQYDVTSDSWWVKAPFDTPRRSVAGFVISNAAYVGTGKANSGSRRDFWQYEQYITGEEEFAIDAPKIYPNPVIHDFTITAPSSVQRFPDNSLLSIISPDGKIVHQSDVSMQYEAHIDASAFAAGTYIIQVSNDSWHSHTTLVKL